MNISFFQLAIFLLLFFENECAFCNYPEELPQTLRIFCFSEYWLFATKAILNDQPSHRICCVIAQAYLHSIWFIRVQDSHTAYAGFAL